MWENQYSVIVFRSILHYCDSQESLGCIALKAITKNEHGLNTQGAVKNPLCIPSQPNIQYLPTLAKKVVKYHHCMYLPWISCWSKLSLFYVSCDDLPDHGVGHHCGRGIPIRGENWKHFAAWDVQFSDDHLWSITYCYSIHLLGLWIPVVLFLLYLMQHLWLKQGYFLLLFSLPN